MLLRLQPYMLSILRIMTGLLFLEHGLNKIFDFPPSPTPRSYVLLTLVPGLQGLLEAIGGLLITAGLFTRITAFILAGDMAVAYFWRHAPNNFYPMLNNGDAAILYCFVFLYLWIAGGGAWSLDRLLRGRSPAPELAASRS